MSAITAGRSQSYIFLKRWQFLTADAKPQITRLKTAYIRNLMSLKCEVQGICCVPVERTDCIWSSDQGRNNKPCKVVKFYLRI